MSAMEIFELRRNNLAKVIDQLIDSQQFNNGKEICEHFGLSAAYITQLLNSKRQIGEKAARELEQQLGLESLILDRAEAPVIEVVSSPVKVTLFQMQVVEQQAFKLKAIDSVEGLLPWFKSEPQYYAIQVTGQYYFPSLKAGWWLVCDEQAELQPSVLMCLYLSNGLQLIVELISESQDSYQIQSLDESRKVSFQKADVAKIHPVIAIVPPQQFS
ncbi:hypothetical protein [Acinetobacter variabilis]|uniref:hypothetical protein n=1 Tax=Acinetobacter variabilis TaxID=70346 RepID=UPI0030F6D3BD